MLCLHVLVECPTRRAHFAAYMAKRPARLLVLCLHGRDKLSPIVSGFLLAAGGRRLDHRTLRGLLSSNGTRRQRIVSYKFCDFGWEW